MVWASQKIVGRMEEVDLVRPRKRTAKIATMTRSYVGSGIPKLPGGYWYFWNFVYPGRKHVA